jgi:hypothetical protein
VQVVAPRLDAVVTGGVPRSRAADGNAGAPTLYRNDPVFRLLLGRWRLGERGVAALTLVLGFGVLTTWYLIGLAVDPAARGRRGPLEYYSASLGDLALIPLLNAAAVRHVRRVVEGLLLAIAATHHGARRLLALVERSYNAPQGRTFAVAVAAVAVTLQHLDELYGLDRNWTVPEWGHLRPVAAYHQLFFACEAFVVAFLVVRHVVTVRLLLRLGRDETGRARLAPVAEQGLRIYGWVLLGWGAFVSLRVMDFFHLTPTVSAAAIVMLPAPMTALVVYYVALIVTGVAPTVGVIRRYELGWAGRPIALLAACLVAPVAGPAGRILVARFLSI